jgi:hypothetical protein
MSKQPPLHECVKDLVKFYKEEGLLDEQILSIPTNELLASMAMKLFDLEIQVGELRARLYRVESSLHSE